MKSIVRKEVWLEQNVIEKLQLKATKKKRKLKPYMEVILETEANKPIKP